MHFRDLEEALDRTLIILKLHRDKNKTIQYNFNIIPLDGTFYADLDPDNELMVQEVKDRFY